MQDKTDGIPPEPDLQDRLASFSTFMIPTTSSEMKDNLPGAIMSGLQSVADYL